MNTCMYTVPSPVSCLQATSGIVQFTVSWTPPSESNRVIICYEVRSNNQHISHTAHTERPPLPPNTSTVVTFRVRAYTIIGQGEYVTE